MDNSERHGQDAGPLVDFAAADFAVVRKFFHRGDGLGQELDDDRSGDVGGEADKDDTEGGEAAAGNEVEEA